MQDNGRTLEKGVPARNKPVLLNNHYVIPYNPYLSQKFKCHINVEVCVSIAAVKYVYKYIYKGNDRADVLIHEVWYQDEIKNYTNARYVFAETTIMMIMICLNIRIGKGTDWKTLRRNPI